MIGIEIDPDKIMLRKMARQFTRIIRKDIFFIFLVPPEGCYKYELEQRMRPYWNKYIFKTWLGKIVKRRLLDTEEREGETYLTRNLSWLPFHKQIIAVELKLNAMQAVLDQAHSHRSFTTETWAALPMPRLSKCRKVTIDRFKLCGVGLLAVWPYKCKVWAEPEIRMPQEHKDKVDSTFVAECVWQNFRKDL